MTVVSHIVCNLYHSVNRKSQVS